MTGAEGAVVVGLAVAVGALLVYELFEWLRRG